MNTPVQPSSVDDSGRLRRPPAAPVQAAGNRSLRFQLGVDNVLSVNPGELARQLAPFFDDLFAGVEGLRMVACMGCASAAGEPGKDFRALFACAYDRLDRFMSSFRSKTPATRHLAAVLSDLLHGGLAGLRSSPLLAGDAAAVEALGDAEMSAQLDAAAAHVLQQQDLLHGLRSDRPGAMSVGRLFADHGGVVRRLMPRAELSCAGVADHRLDGTSRQPELLLGLLAYLNQSLENGGSTKAACRFDFAAQGWTLRLASAPGRKPGAPHDRDLVADMVASMDGRVRYDAPSGGEWLLEAWFPYGGGDPLGPRIPAAASFEPSVPLDCAIDLDDPDGGN